MTTLENRSATALLVVDVQNVVVDGAYRRDAVVANIVAPANNHPPGYPDYTIYHYFTVFGYDPVDRTVVIADPANFGGNATSANGMTVTANSDNNATSTIAVISVGLFAGALSSAFASVTPQAKTSAGVTGPASLGRTSTASVISPESVLTASRPAISLPSALDVRSTAAGCRLSTS